MLLPSQGITSGGIRGPSVSRWWWQFWSPSQDAVQCLPCIATHFYSPVSVRRHCKTMPISWFLQKILSLASTEDSCLRAAKWWLSNTGTHCTFMNQPSPSIPYLKSIGMDLKLLLFFSGLKPMTILNYFVTETVLEVARGSPGRMSTVTCPHHRHRHLFTFRQNKMF